MVSVRTIIRNIASNWTGYCVYVTVAFFLTPYILRSLGETRYGIWTLAMGLTGYYGLLDLGFSSGVTQYLTRYLAAKDMAGLNRTASTGVVALTGCGVAVLLGSIVIALNASSFFQIPATLTREVALVIAITGVSAGIQFVFFTYSAVFVCVQRFDLSNAIGITTRLISAAGTVVCLKLGYGLVGLSLILAGTNLIDYLLRWRVATRVLPEMKISYKLASLRSVSEVMKFGAWNMVIAGSVRLISYTDALVIAAFMPVAAVAPFTIAASLRSYFDEIFARIGHVFFPAATDLDARGDRDGLRKLYLTSSKFMFLGSITCGSLAICWAREFFSLWIGSTYADPAGYPSVASLFYLLVLGSIVSVAQRVGYQVLQGTRQVGLLASMFAIEGVSNLLLSVVLVRVYGLFGVALGTLFPALVCQGVLQPYFVCRELKISLSTYFSQVLLRPILVSVVIFPVLLISFAIATVGNWPTLVLWASVSAVLMLPAIVWVGLTKSERDLLLTRPMTIVLAKFRVVLST